MDVVAGATVAHHSARGCAPRAGEAHDRPDGGVDSEILAGVRGITWKAGESSGPGGRLSCAITGAEKRFGCAWQSYAQCGSLGDRSAGVKILNRDLRHDDGGSFGLRHDVHEGERFAPRTLGQGIRRGRCGKRCPCHRPFQVPIIRRDHAVMGQRKTWDSVEADEPATDAAPAVAKNKVAIGKRLP